jgi:hypothetical protein
LPVPHWPPRANVRSWSALSLALGRGNETARVHHASRRRGSHLAARRADSNPHGASACLCHGLRTTRTGRLAHGLSWTRCKRQAGRRHKRSELSLEFAKLRRQPSPATGRTRSPSHRNNTPNFASRMRTASCSMAWNIRSSWPGDELMTRNTSAVAFSRSSASWCSRVRRAISGGVRRRFSVN